MGIIFFIYNNFKSWNIKENIAGASKPAAGQSKIDDVLAVVVKFQSKGENPNKLGTVLQVQIKVAKGGEQDERKLCN